MLLNSIEMQDKLEGSDNFKVSRATWIVYLTYVTNLWHGLNLISW